jgi:hypothetical protein
MRRDLRRHVDAAVTGIVAASAFALSTLTGCEAFLEAASAGGQSFGSHPLGPQPGNTGGGISCVPGPVNMCGGRCDVCVSDGTGGHCAHVAGCY